eukprot:ANDGO_08183.mRNA.1 Glucose-6-phosphate isomerase
MTVSVFFDEATGFELDYSSFVQSVSSAGNEVLVGKALKIASRVESGETVNGSEGRAVDHYNLRHVSECVKGKSLDHSLQQWAQIKQVVDALDWEARFDVVIFNGIGGSYLGPLMLLVALRKLNPKFKFLANTDPRTFAEVTQGHKPERMLMVHMSKSGSTAETRGNMEAFLKTYPGCKNMAITIKGSMLDKLAGSSEYAAQFNGVFSMNQETGGRTSVWSAIAMVPFAFAGADFEAFMKGASHMDQLTRRPNVLENPAMIMALAVQSFKPDHKNMIVLSYCDALSEYAHYLQQLYMESLGKSEPSQFGQTVFGGVGTGEQHAFMQQVQKGIDDAFVRFIHVRERNVDYENPRAGSMGRQLLAFVRGTQNALVKNNRKFLSQSVQKLDAFAMGMLIALEERVVTFLAGFWDVNAYDQPGVEDGKKAADAMNVMSLKLEAKIREMSHAKGTASQLFAEPEFADEMGVHLLLGDIAANGSVSYNLNGRKVRRVSATEWEITAN